MLDGLPDSQRQLLLNALATYGDACALPLLTPECPYYQTSDEIPSCGEQCREVLMELGSNSRQTRHVSITGGLVMHGWALPVSAATGMNDFDAGQKYIEDRRKPVGNQCSSSLLLGMSARLQESVSPQFRGGRQGLEALASELQRRGFPVESIVRESILPSLAGTVLVLAALPALQDAGMLPIGASSDLAQTLRRDSESGWGRVLMAAVEDEGSFEEVRRLVTSSRPDPRLFPAVDPLSRLSRAGRMPEEWSLDLQDSNAVTALYAFTARFSNRVLSWLIRCLETDSSNLSAWPVPPRPVFLALSDTPPPRDEKAAWIWERYTETSIESWSESSLLLEWRVLSGIDDPPILRVSWSERRTDRDRIANLALRRSSARPLSRAVRSRYTNGADDFVNAAIAFLKAGEYGRAVEIFEGLVELTPQDGDALNNLGFCLLPIDAEAALRRLQEASLLPRKIPITNICNRVLALHLVGRDGDARQLIDAASGLDRVECSVWLWRHLCGEEGLDLIKVGDAEQYLHDLTLMLSKE